MAATKASLQCMKALLDGDAQIASIVNVRKGEMMLGRLTEDGKASN